MTPSEQVIKWVLDHPLISINGLEKSVGMPQRTLSKAVKGLDGRSISPKHLPSLIAELSKYGFKPKK